MEEIRKDGNWVLCACVHRPKRCAGTCCKHDLRPASQLKLFCTFQSAKGPRACDYSTLLSEKNAREEEKMRIRTGTNLAISEEKTAKQGLDLSRAIIYAGTVISSICHGRWTSKERMACS